MRSLQTTRLRLVPLSIAQLGLWLNNAGMLEQSLCCHNAAGHMTNEVREIVAHLCQTLPRGHNNLLWRTFWLMIRREDSMVVGSAVFKGPPDAAGAVEIGYGLDPDFVRYGYMAEAVCALCNWALQQHGVYSVTAETASDNIASQKVLIRCGFELCQSGESLWWRLT